MKRLRLGLVLLQVLLLWPALCRAQQLSLQLESDEVYANLPFVLQVVARGFDENPQPTLSKLSIPGCRVTPLGVAPNVSSMIQIINGQRSESRSVTYAFRFRIEAAQPGQYTVPGLVAEQGGKKAQSPPARFSVKAVDDTKDMQLRLILPERPLYVGETVDGTLEWYLRRDVGNRSFAVPLFDQDDWLEVESPPGQPRLAGFPAGSRQLELPYTQDKASIDGVEYTRFRFQFRLTPTRAGTLSPPPSRVVAVLNVGMGHDLFGFQVPEQRLFQAVAKPTRLEIRPLPQAGRPASFKNAVGSSFGMEVQAGRTVVRVGDPIELRILLRGNGRLSGLILPELAAMGLSSQLFSAPEEPPAGEVLEDGKGKLFRVSVRLHSTEAKEIPALSFSYFDPGQGSYQTVHSQPIALSVKGSAVVGASDVVDAAALSGNAGAGSGGQKPGPASGTQAASEPVLPLFGADLALSDEHQTFMAARSVKDVLPLLLGLYGLSVAWVVVQLLRRRNLVARQRDAETKKTLHRLKKELEEAAGGAAHDAAPRLCAALRALRKELALPPDEGNALLERLETEAYSPDAATRPLSAALRQQVEGLLKTWLARGQSARSSPGSGKGATIGLLLLLGFSVASVRAQDSAAEQKLKQARAIYKDALSQNDRDRRRSGFAQAEGVLRELAAAYPDRPQLLGDWGNAALLAQEPGRAALAYRRALRLNPALERPRRNLSFLREHLPDWLPRPRGSGAMDSLLSFLPPLSVPQRHLYLAAAVLVFVALFFPGPWLASSRRRRLLRTLSLLPALLGTAMFLSLTLERDQSKDAVVVVSGVLLRSADSLGAPPALGHPLPAGTEVTVTEARGDFTRVTLADNQPGWLPTSSLENL